MAPPFSILYVSIAPSLGSTLETVDKCLIALRRRVLEEVNFDLFTSPRFIEHVVCWACGMKPTGHHSRHDAVHPEGYKIEIKSAALGTRVSDGRKVRRFVFSSLQGVTRAGKDVDVYVLVGVDGERLSFYVIPNSAVSSRSSIEILLYDRKYEVAPRWCTYEKEFADLSSAIARAGWYSRSQLELF